MNIWTVREYGRIAKRYEYDFTLLPLNRESLATIY